MHPFSTPWKMWGYNYEFCVNVNKTPYIYLFSISKIYFDLFEVRGIKYFTSFTECTKCGDKTEYTTIAATGTFDKVSAL